MQLPTGMERTIRVTNGAGGVSNVPFIALLGGILTVIQQRTYSQVGTTHFTACYTHYFTQYIEHCNTINMTENNGSSRYSIVSHLKNVLLKLFSPLTVRCNWFLVLFNMLAINKYLRKYSVAHSIQYRFVRTLNMLTVQHTILTGNISHICPFCGVTLFAG